MLMKILIAEDESIESEALQKILMKHYPDAVDEIVVCRDGKSAVDKTAETEPDLIFMDIQMPLMDGITASGKIREFNKTVPIIMLTAYGTFDYAQKSIGNRVTDYILKPYSVKTIKSTMDRVVNDYETRKLTEHTLERMNSILVHEFLLRLLLNDGLPLADKQEYIGMMDLENYCYFVCICPADHAAVPPDPAFRILNCSLNQITCSVICSLDREKSEGLKKTLTDAGEICSGIEDDWDRIDSCVSECSRKSSNRKYETENIEAEKRLYNAVLNRNMTEIEACCGEILGSPLIASENLQPASCRLFESLYNGLLGVNSSDSEKMKAVMGIRFRDSYMGDRAEAAKDLKENITKLADYMSSNMQNKKNRLIRQAKTFMEQHYRENISLGEIAESIPVSKFYLSHMFHDVTGENIKEYLMNFRVDRAIELLNTGRTISEIAFETGFEDPAYFSKCFKKKTGVSPTQYHENV
jgi:two-component system response regulator YesN